MPTPRPITDARAAFVALLFAWAATPAFAADRFGDSTLAGVSTGGVRHAPSIFGGDFVLAPIPFSNPTIESGLGLAGAYLFTFDPASATSFIGVGGFRSANGSRGAGAGVSLSFAGDAWRVSAFGGAADVNYDLYGVGAGSGVSLPISQNGWLARVEVRRRVTDGVYLGARLRYLSARTTARFSARPGRINVPDIGLDITAGLAGPTLEMDFRDDSVAPRAGWRLDAALLFSFDEPLGRSGYYDYRTFTATFDHYLPLFTADTFATRLAVCNIDGEAPFFDLCALGGNDGFRGYPNGQYFDRTLASAQAEYRGRFSERWGWVAFAGAGAVADGISAFDAGDIKPSAGIGARYRLSKDFGLDFSADLAYGEEGAAAYVYLGQDF